jgi:hypothetical protein
LWRVAGAAFQAVHSKEVSAVSAIRDRWVTFDCFGTLVDWHKGFTEILSPFAHERVSDVVRA